MTYIQNVIYQNFVNATHYHTKTNKSKSYNSYNIQHYLESGNSTNVHQYINVNQLVVYIKSEASFSDTKYMVNIDQ
jgi:hypothetical protein